MQIPRPPGHDDPDPSVFRAPPRTLWMALMPGLSPDVIREEAVKLRMLSEVEVEDAETGRRSRRLIGPTLAFLRAEQCCALRDACASRLGLPVPWGPGAR